MLLEEILGRFVTLPVRHFGPPGAFLALGEREDLLLLGSEIPEGTRPGDTLEVFVYLDSEDRPLATLASPRVELGQVAFLTVTDVTHVGAFVDWGLPKELLVPFAEQTSELRPGASHPFGLYVDTSGRLAGTMKISEMLASASSAKWQRGEWVEGEAWRYEPDLGLFVIVERSFVGLVPSSEPHALARGEAARFRIANVLRDGKIELSLRRAAHEELEDDARRILDVLHRKDAPTLSEASSPEDIRDALGMSKKAFKRAVGRLLREGAVELDQAGVVRRRG